MAPIQNPTGSSTNQSAADFEPDEQWKSQLKVDIESNLRSMVDEAKQNLHDTLKKAPVSIVERKRLTEEHLTTMKNICNLAEGQFRISLERERQVRRWAAGQVLDQEWSDTMRKEQQAILDNIERNHKDKATHSSQPIADPSISRSNRPPERVWTEHEHEAGYFPRLSSREFEEDHVPPPRNTGKARAGSVSSAVGSYKLPSTLDTTDGGFERPKPSPTIDELDDIPRSAHSATDVQDSIRCGSPCHKASISTGQPPEIWRPSITPEQDAQMSRTFSIARRGSTASATSSYWAPSVLNIPFSYEPHDSAMERERERISAMKQEWSSMDRMRQRERTMSYTYAEARASVTATPQWLDERYAPPSSSVAPIISSAIPHTRPVESSSSTAPIAYTRPAHSQSSTAPIRYTRSSDSSRPHAPPPSASRPIVTNKSFTFDGGDFQASPSSKSWTGPSRSPQAPEEIPQNWWSSNLCAGPSSQDMRYGYNVGETGYYAARPVHTHHEVSEGEHDVDLDDTEGEYDEVSEGEYDEVSEGEYDMDLDDAESQEYDERQMPQREASVSLRSKGVAQPEQELRREKNARREAKLKEELTSDDKQKDGFRKHKDKKKQEKFEWESWNCNPPGTSRPTPPPQMATSQSQSSSSSTGPWPITNRSDHSMPEPSRPTDRSSFGSTSTSRISAAWTSSTRPNLTASSYPPSTPKPPTLSAQQNAKTTLGPPPTFFSEAEFHRRQAEQAQQHEEQFRREQAKLEQERLSKAVKVKQVKQDASAIELFERHRGQWDKLQMSRMLIWDNFPWPVFKRSSGPDDITTPGIIAYMLSSLHPIDKSPRHRVKENIKRWHHDRFEIWLLPKVKESDRDSVREAASTVARTLYHLLRSGTQDPDVSTASSRIIVLEAPILLAQQNTNVSSHLTYTPIPTTQISTSPSPEATAIVEEASQELPDSVSDSLEDLTNELQGKSSFPAASGGFGDIWKCILVKANENVDVAVKTIRAFEMDNEESRQKKARRVRRELKVWGRLKHHSILPLWGVANDFGPYLAMICPWAVNGALTGYLERQQDTLSSLDKFSLLNDIALGLQYLHSKSVVHGDLTGSNVLISDNGRACLADFGLSTIIVEFIGTSYFTSSIRGNARWVAAELCEAPEDSEASLSTECDIYSFGSITLQILTCKVPYYNVKKDIAVLSQVIKGIKPEPPEESQIASGHWEFIQRCWLPRASRPSIAEIVTFIVREQQALSP